jgi:hypothetical protein
VLLTCFRRTCYSGFLFPYGLLRRLTSPYSHDRVCRPNLSNDAPDPHRHVTTHPASHDCATHLPTPQTTFPNLYILGRCLHITRPESLMKNRVRSRAHERRKITNVAEDNKRLHRNTCSSWPFMILRRDMGDCSASQRSTIGDCRTTAKYQHWISLRGQTAQSQLRRSRKT